MDKISTQALQELLRRRLGTFVSRSPHWGPVLREVVGRVQQKGWTVLIFGGTLRDLLAGPETAVPRDLDLVVSGATSEQLRATFASEVVRVTRFGGLHLQVNKLPVDLWTLESTWAFRERLVADVSFESLTRTTFLSVEAVAAELGTSAGHEYRLYSNGFFESMQQKVLEINLEANPFPTLCVVRSLLTAQRLGFSIGPKLARYLVHHGEKATMEELEAVQRSHYGQVRLDRHELHSLLKLIRQQAGRSHAATPLQLPQVRRFDWYTRWPLIPEPQRSEEDEEPVLQPLAHTAS